MSWEDISFFIYPQQHSVEDKNLVDLNHILNLDLTSFLTLGNLLYLVVAWFHQL